jgi:hypothetical protein
MHSFLRLVLAEYNHWAITNKALVRRQAVSQPHNEKCLWPPPGSLREFPYAPEFGRGGAKWGFESGVDQPHDLRLYSDPTKNSS